MLHIGFGDDILEKLRDADVPGDRKSQVVRSL